MMSAEESARIPTGTSHESKLIKRIKATIHKPELTDDDEDYLQAVLDLIRDGKLPKFTITKVEKSIENDIDPLKIVAKIRAGISPDLFGGVHSGAPTNTSGVREVVLSEYLVRGGNDG